MTKLQTVQNALVKKRVVSLFLLISLALLGLILFNTVKDILRPFEVVEYTPKNDSLSGVIKGPFISVQFTKPVDEKTQKEMKFLITPQTKFDAIWENAQNVILTNEHRDSALEVDTKYSVKILDKERSLAQWSFSTRNINSLSEDQQFQKFAQGQQQLHEYAKDKIAERPWTEKLPIKNKSYIVFWNDAKETILIQLFIRTGNYNSQEKIDAAVNDIKAQLQQLGVDTNKEKIEVVKLTI